MAPGLSRLLSILQLKGRFLGLGKGEADALLDESMLTQAPREVLQKQSGHQCR